MSKKLSIIEREYGKKRFVVFYARQKLDAFSTKEAANEYAQMYLVPPYTMQSNIWYTK